MSITIFKETFRLSDVGADDKVRLMLPAFAEVLTVAEQIKDSGSLQVWYRCNPEVGRVEHFLHVICTGNLAPVKVDARYLSTVILMGGGLVLHFFDERAA